MSSMSTMPPELRRLATQSLLFALAVAVCGIALLAVCVTHGGAWFSAGQAFLIAAVAVIYAPPKIRSIVAHSGGVRISDLVALAVLLAAIVLHVRSSLAGGHLVMDGIAALIGFAVAAAAAVGVVQWEKRTGYGKMRSAWLASQVAERTTRKHVA